MKVYVDLESAVQIHPPKKKLHIARFMNSDVAYCGARRGDKPRKFITITRDNCCEICYALWMLDDDDTDSQS